MKVLELARENAARLTLVVWTLALILLVAQSAMTAGQAAENQSNGIDDANQTNSTETRETPDTSVQTPTSPDQEPRDADLHGTDCDNATGVNLAGCDDEIHPGEEGYSDYNTSDDTN